MLLVVLHTPKGGSGKSTLARELAVCAVQSGVKAALADLDPQGTTTGWYRRREAPEPPLVAFNPSGDGAELAAAGVEMLLVDTPPGEVPYLGALLQRAAAVVVPVRSTPDDLLAAAPIARSLARHPAWAFILSQTPPRSRLLPGAVRQLASLGRVAPAHLTFRADFPAAAIEGKVAAEFTGKAAEETRQTFAYLQTLLGGPHGPPRG